MDPAILFMEVVDRVVWPGALVGSVFALRRPVTEVVARLYREREGTATRDFYRLVQVAPAASADGARPAEGDAAPSSWSSAPATDELVQTLRDLQGKAGAALDARVAGDDDARRLVETYAGCVDALERDLYWERLHRTLFGSQLALLQLLATSPGGALPRDRVEPFYRRFAAQADAAARQAGSSWNVDFDAWAGFLMSCGLVRGTADGGCVLTPKGAAFLAYVAAHCPASAAPPF